MYRCLLALFLLAVGVNVAEAQGDVKVNHITPSLGGYNGATRINVFGEAFPVDLKLDDTEPVNEVYLISSLREYTCEVHKEESDENQVVCYTSPMEEGVYYVRLRVHGVWLDDSQYCGGNPTAWWCRFQVWPWRTPLLSDLSWYTNEPKQLITVNGRTYTNLISSNEAEADNGMTANIVRVWLTSGVCNLFNPDNFQEPYGAHLYGESHWGNFTCLVESSFVGNQNLSFIVNEDFGRSAPYTTVKRVSATNQIYMLQTYAVVTGVSPAEGSVMGGTLLTISGRFFDDLSGIKAKVDVGGEECSVQTVSDNEITCRTPAQPSTRSLYSGGRGMNVECYTGVSRFEDIDSAVGAYCGFVDHTHPDDVFTGESNFASQARGFFVPSTTATHSFSISANNQAKLYFNPSGIEESGKVDIVTATSTVKVWSAGYDLTAGMEYYYEVLHLDSGGNANFKLGVLVHDTDFTPQQISSAITAEQTISISSTVDKEVQTISFEDWSEQTPVSTEWEIVFTCNDIESSCLTLPFTLSVFGVETDQIYYDETSLMSTMKSSLESLLPLAGETVEVNVIDGVGYTIIFHSTRGNIPLTVQSSVPTTLEISVNPVVTGMPQLDTFTLKIGDKISAPVTYDGTTEDVANAVKSLFGAICPSQLESGIGAARLYYADMESGESTPTGTRSSIRSFCGIYSLQNPSYLYNNGDNPYNPSLYSHVCFAYSGNIADSLRLSYDYKARNEENNLQWYSVSLRTFTSVELYSDDEGWKYWCRNIFEMLQNEHTNALEFRVKAVYIARNSGSETDLFVDNIFIGTAMVSATDREALLQRVIPPAVENIKLESVEVTKTNNSYTITFNPIDCGHNFPLLEFGFQSDKTEHAADHHEYEFYDGTPKAHVRRVTAASPPVTGSFDITFDDASFKRLSDLPANMSEEYLKDNLETLEQIKSVRVERDGTCSGYSWKIYFDSPGGKYPDMIIDGDGSLISIPAGVAVEVKDTVIGGLYMDPAYGDFIRTAHIKPQVQVYINSIPSRCETGSDGTSPCDFSWEDSSTPEVTSVSPASVSTGTTITITGTGFSDTSSQNHVLVGGVMCAITSSSETSIECTIGNSPAGSHTLTLNVDGAGLAQGSVDVEVTSVATSISPASGSVYGCTTVTISGSGFSESTVMIGTSVCEVFELTYDTISCITTPGTAGTYDVTVTTGGAPITLASAFEYVDGGSAVTTLSKTALSVAGGEETTVTGSGFGTVEGQVYFGENLITDVTSWTDTDIVLTSPSLAPADYDVKVVVGTIGCASSALSVQYTFDATGITPASGSLIGGTIVTVDGSGFTADTKVSFVDSAKLEESLCNDVTINGAGTSLTCSTPAASKTHVVRNTGSHPTYGVGYAWEPSTLEIMVGDQVQFYWSFPRLLTVVEIGLHTTANAAERDYDGAGFQVEPTSSGQYTASFTEVGQVFYSSGCVGENCEVVMKGTINVVEATTFSASVLVKANGQEAAYSAGSLAFAYDQDATPKVSNISPRNGTTSTDITIAGTFIGVSPSVLIGGKECGVESSDATTIVCKVQPAVELDVGVYHAVEVNMEGKGNARIEIKNVVDRTFALLPLVTSVSPVEGSLAGGTKITIQGSGFSDSSIVELPGSVTCDVVAEETTYTTITCLTRFVSSEIAGQIKVTQGNSEAVCEPTTACDYSFSDSATPVVSSWINGGDWENTELTFDGTGFGTEVANVNVKLTSGSTEQGCTITSATETQVSCTVQRLVVGNNDISLSVAEKGLARFDGALNYFNNPATINSIEPNAGSINGGTKLQVTGNGFVAEDTTVTVDGEDCAVVTVDLATIECTTAAHIAGTVVVEVVSNGVTFPTDGHSFEYSAASTPTVTSMTPTTGVEGDVVTITGSGFGTNAIVNIGDVNCPVASVVDAEITCTLGRREGGTASIQVTAIPTGLATVSGLSFEYRLAIGNVAPNTGSFGGGQEVTVTGDGFSENTVVRVCGIPCESQTFVSAAEITCFTPSNDDGAATKACPLEVANGDNVVEDEYTYDRSLTPTVTSISRERGGTAGGTEIVLEGTGFTSIGTSLSVSIDGSDCIVSGSSDTSITCVTEPHLGSVLAQVKVSVGDPGNALSTGINFFYIDLWSSIFTWGGTSVPTVQDFVIIQKGQTILLDTDTAVLKMLLIDGGELIFDKKDVKLSAENILITNGGLLQVGTEEEPFEHKAEIIMYGNLRSPELPIYGAKTLGVRNGTLDLHGRHVLHTWTKLDATAAAGASQIVLEKAVSDWQVGDEIVIASTGHRHSQSENEKKTITAVSADGFTLTLDSPLEYEHLGVSESFSGVTVQFRAEVGLLTRNVVFRGSNDHAWHDTIEKCEDGFETGQFATQTCFQGRFGEEVGSDQFGASIMIHSPAPDSPDIMVRIENIEVTYAGQAFRLGRYPIHWHLMGNVDGMYVKGCAIHKTFNRAVTIHGTHNLTVDRNVVYDIMGGAIFIEDGIETRNKIRYNLAVFVRQSTSLLNDDVTPAAYWVTNPDNDLEHNHAAGGTHFGFWYRMHEHPDGPSFTATICQQHVELGSFQNNTVHSQGWFGLWIFQDYFPMVGGGCGATTPSPARFRSLTTWNCEKGAEWVNCGAIQFIDFVMVDNEVTGMDLKLIKGTEWNEERGAMVKDSLIVGHSAQSSATFESQVGITLPFSPGLQMKNVVFYNFNRGGTAYFGTTIQGKCVSLCGGFYFWVEGLQFIDVTRKVVWRWLHEGVFLDRDGSLTGSAPYTTVVPFSDVMDPAKCRVQDGIEFSDSTFPSAFCDPDVHFHRLALNNPLPSSLEGNDLYVTNQFGNTSSTYAKKRLTHAEGWMILLQGKESYTMHWEDGTQFTNLTYSARFYDFQDGDYLYMSHDLKQTPDRIAVRNGQTPMPVEDSVPLTSTSNNLDWNYDESTKKFTYIITNPVSSRKKRTAIEIRDPLYEHTSVSPNIYRCHYADCIAPLDPADVPPEREKPEDFTLWSAGSSNPCLEFIGDHTVVVKKNTDAIESCWVVVDVPEISVTNITVLGVLHFDDHDVTVNATYIVTLGGRIIAGFPDDVFVKKLTINLQGNHDTPGWALSSGLDLGSKAIGCFGGCDFHGVRTAVPWTTLDQTANVGDNEIVLSEVVDWSAGDEIVITTTGYKATETEKNVIDNIVTDSGKTTITLRNQLLHRHLGESYTAGDWHYEMRAEVGLLTRNIRIIGEHYPEIDTQAFGGRLLVGFVSIPGEDIYGWARLSNVEFWRTGQEGWTERWDPRFSVAWLNTGTPVEARPSFISSCAFHDGYSTAIGTFGANEISITDNVVHRTIHDGIRITGRGHKLERNLVTVTLFRGAYLDRFELTNFKDWQASFELSEATELTLVNNSASGSERLCYHFDGEPCDAGDENAYQGNIAHGCLHGVQIFIEDGVGECSMIRNFVIYKAWDYGIYHQTQVSVVVRNTVIIDSSVGYLPLIFAPPSLGHEYVDKTATMENILCVGRSEHFDPSIDFMDEVNDKNLLVRAVSPSKKAPSTPTGGKTCVMLPLFASGSNAAPFKAFHQNMNYPAIHGLLQITGLHAHRYKLWSDGTRDLVFFTNPDNEDAHHPTSLRGTVLTEVQRESMVFYERPSLKKINPSDCVDMECDAKKKVLIKDVDGGFLGEPGSCVPEAEFGWDDDTQIQRGLGDYRIPKPLLTATDGTRIPVADIADGKGIIRSSACTYISEWQAYDCHGSDALDYMMLVIESMDADTELRRLSPVALLGDRYIDLNNGPQDHGWCFGYTCQKRLSTFFTIVATNRHFDIFFTGVSPQNLRLHLLNADTTQTVRVAIWYSKPERLDVIRAESKLYVHPQNSYYDEEGGYWSVQQAPPGNQDLYKPAINSSQHGANYMDMATNLLYITLRGSEPVDVVTVPAVIIKFGFPATLTDEEFFGENLIDNLALFLDVPKSKIRLVNIVREDSARKRRDTTGGTVVFTIQYSDELLNETAANSSTATSAALLNDGVEKLIISYQNGTLWSTLGLDVDGTSFGAITADVNGTAEAGTIEFYDIPRRLNVTSLPTSAQEYVVFPLSVSLLSEEGNVVTKPDNTFEVTVSLVKTGAGADMDAQLLGNTSMMFVNGSAQFSDLHITHNGSYELNFEITQPEGMTLDSTAQAITVLPRTVNVAFVATTNYPEHNSEILLTLELQGSDNQKLSNIGFKGNTWKAEVSLDQPSLYGSTSLDGVTSFTFDSVSGQAVTNGLRLLSTKDFFKYSLVFRVYTEPTHYADVVVRPDPIEFVPVGSGNAFPTGAMAKMKIITAGQPYLTRSNSFASKSAMMVFVSNYIAEALSGFNGSVRINNFDLETNAAGNSVFEFDLSADTVSAFDTAINTIKTKFTTDTSGLTVDGITIRLVGSCIFVNNICESSTTETVVTPAIMTAGGESGTPTWVYVLIGVVVAVVLAGALIALSCFLKRAKTNKVGSSGGGCLDANSSRGSSPVGDSWYTGSTTATPNSNATFINNYPESRPVSQTPLHV